MREQIFLRNRVSAAEVLTAAGTLGYSVEQRIEGTQETPGEAHLESPDRPGSRIRYVENNQIGVNHLVIDGPHAAALRVDLEPLLAHYDRDTAYERAAAEGNIEEKITALFHLALSRGPVADSHVLRLIGQLLVHHDETVRQAAVVAAAYFEWPDVLPMLDDLIARETNGRTRDDAMLVCSRLRAQPEGAHHITGFERLDVHTGSRIEIIWGYREIDDRYRVASIPQDTFNLSINDTVVVDTRDGLNTLMLVDRKSDHRTLWVDTGAHPRRSDEVEALMRKHRVRVEVQRLGRVAIDVPPYIEFPAIAADLDGAALAWEIADPQPDQPVPTAPSEGRRKKR